MALRKDGRAKLRYSDQEREAQEPLGSSRKSDFLAQCSSIDETICMSLYLQRELGGAAAPIFNVAQCCLALADLLAELFKGKAAFLAEFS